MERDRKKAEKVPKETWDRNRTREGPLYIDLPVACDEKSTACLSNARKRKDREEVEGQKWV